MQYRGIDTAARISAPAAKTLAAEGISFVGRYLVPPGMTKEISAGEAQELLSAGLAILLCWELGENRAAEGAHAGLKDGARARDLAQELGVPQPTAIFFAVDYLPRASEYGEIEAYFRAAQAAVRPYACGIYGPYDIAGAMKAKMPELRIWQCVGGSGGRIREDLDVYQYSGSAAAEAKAIQAKAGFPVDMDAAESLDGLWQPAPPWYADTVAWALEEGVVTEARPTDPATRAEVMQMIRNYNRRFEAEDDYSIGTKG